MKRGRKRGGAETRRPETPAAGARRVPEDAGTDVPARRGRGRPPETRDRPTDEEPLELEIVTEESEAQDLDLDDGGERGAGRSARLEASDYEEIRRLLAGMFREAAGLAEAQESTCAMLYDELDHYSWIGIYMVDGDELELAAWAGPEETEHTRIPIGEGICGLAAQTGETEIVPDVTRNDRFIACFPSTRSEIVVPILRDGEVLGEIDVDSDLLDAFDDRDARLLEWTASRLAVLA